MVTKLIGWWGLLGLLALAAPVQADIVEYLHTDLQGSVVAVTNEAGAVIERREYEPYGLPRTPVADGPGYTGHDHDPESGLVYMQQRYYDPEVGRFLSVDPVGVSPATGGNFNRYWYANNNPYTYVDPDGQLAICAVPTGPMQVCIAAAIKAAKVTVLVGSAAVAAIGGLIVHNEISEDGGSQGAPSASGNTNPYDGPVDEPVIVVDDTGNAIPVGSGEQIGASSEGDYQQVKDRDGAPTGTRLDKGGHRGHTDPKARGPHGHRPGVTDESGNPHLPVNPPRQRDLDPPIDQ